MVNSCIAPGCHSGYKATKATSHEEIAVGDKDDPGDTLSYHKFPTDPELLGQWLHAIPRKDWQPSSNARVCSKHFRPEDYQEKSVDTNEWRKSKMEKASLARRKLKPGAIPSIFPNLPHYLSKAMPKERKTSATASKRWEKEEEVLQKKIEDFTIADQLQSFQALDENISEICLPGGVSVVKTTEGFQFISLAVAKAMHCKINFCLNVFHDLTYDIWVNEELISQSEVHHITGNNSSLLTISSVGNLVAFAKSRHESGRTVTEMTLDVIIDKFEDSIDKIADIEEEHTKRLGFLLEQLKLLTMKQPRYSPELLACSAMWNTSSPSLYKQIQQENILSLPTPRYISKLSRGVSTGLGLSSATEAYLKRRFKTLKQREQYVVLMIDEIYCNQKLEYSCGKFFGHTDTGMPKTLLSFMIKSVAGNYSDMVAMWPISSLDAIQIMLMKMDGLTGLTQQNFCSKFGYGGTWPM